MIHHIQTKNSYSTPIAITIVSASPKIRHLTSHNFDVGIDIYFCRKILQHVDVGNKRQYGSDNYKVGNGPP
jgi:hypothetical protein